VEHVAKRGGRATAACEDISLRAIAAIFYAIRYTKAVHHVARPNAQALIFVGFGLISDCEFHANWLELAPRVPLY
jgi:hypothetical protein